MDRGWVGQDARPTGLVQVFAKSVASIVVDRISLLPFNPTYDANLRGDYRLGNLRYVLCCQKLGFFLRCALSFDVS